MRIRWNPLLDFLNRCPEILDAPESSAGGPPVIVGKLIDEKCRRFDDREGVLRVAVDELRSELDGQGNIDFVKGENATADALACFENDDRFTGSGEVARCSKSCCAATDDDYIYAVGHIR